MRYRMRQRQPATNPAAAGNHARNAAADESLLALAHWRRTVAALYAEVRRAPARERALAHARFCAARDTLFKQHPSSPLGPTARADFTALPYYPYRPEWRVDAALDERFEPGAHPSNPPGEDALRYRPVARVRFRVSGRRLALTLFWIEGYGGGLFLPFRDRTNGADTYGGGRYLYDTIKGADLGAGADGLVLDFNYAYHPSCAYDSRWHCPLAPPQNHLPLAVPAGERLPVD